MAGSPLARPTDAPPTGARRRPATEAPTAPPSPRRRRRPSRSCPTDLPRHVAIIMDGNRRWARLHDLPELEGHAAGVEAIRILLKHAVRRGVPVMTLYAFSRENWARSDDEVRGLFALLEQAIRSETAELRDAGRPDPAPRPARGAAGRHPPLDRRGARGDRRRDPPPPQRRVQLRRPDGARRRVPAARRERRSPRRRSTRTTISDALYTAGLPDPDLVDPDRRRAAALELPHLAVGLRRVLLDRGPLAGLRRGRVRRGAPRVRPPDPPVRALTTATAPPAPARPTLRQRAISTAILVPPLLIVLVLGGPWIVALIAVAAGLAGDRGLPAARRGGLSVDARCSGIAFARRASSSTAARPDEPRRQRPDPRRDRDDPRRGRGVREARSARRPADVVRDRVRRAVRRRCSGSSSGSASRRRSRRRARRSRSSAASAAGSCSSSSACGPTTPARTSSASGSAGRSSSPTSRRRRPTPG